MSFSFNTAVIPLVPASAAGAISYCNQIAAIIVAANSDWSAAAATQIGTADAAFVVLTHQNGDRLSIAAGAGGSSTTMIAAAQAYSGANIRHDTKALYVSFIPASQAGAVPTPNSGSLLTKQMAYSVIGGLHISATENRIYVWSRNSDLILAIQQNTASPTINAVGYIGRFCTTVLNSEDSGVDNNIIQWTTSSLVVPTNSATGDGQCYSSSDSRIQTISPICLSYLVDPGRQLPSASEVRTLGCVISSASLNIVSTISALKGEFDIGALRIGPTGTTLRATRSNGQLVHIGAGFLLPWDSSWGVMP